MIQKLFTFEQGLPLAVVCGESFTLNLRLVDAFRNGTLGQEAAIAAGATDSMGMALCELLDAQRLHLYTIAPLLLVWLAQRKCMHTRICELF